MVDGAGPPNFGEIVSVRGSVVDAKFEQRLPPIFSILSVPERRTGS
jgi:F0F1-type ATP synthase beta subunit